MPTQNIADRLVGDVMTEVRQRSGDAVVTQLEFSRAICTISRSTSGSIFRLFTVANQERWGDVPGVQLLGVPQEQFLDRWAQDWATGHFCRFPACP